MFGLFKKSEKNTTTGLSDDRVGELVLAYAELLDDRTPAPKPDAILPATKVEMDAALLRAIELTPPGDMRQHLRNSYLWLSDYQPMSGEEAAACKLHDAALNQLGDGSPEDLKGRALVVSETSETFSHWSKMCLDEMQDRAAELNRRFG